MTQSRVLRVRDGNGRWVHECSDCHYFLCPACGGHCIAIGSYGPNTAERAMGLTKNRYQCRPCGERFNVTLTEKQRAKWVRRSQRAYEASKRKAAA